MKRLLVIGLVTLLSGCVHYTNDKGQECRAEVDPITAVASVPFMIVNPERGYPGTICKKNKGTE